MPFYDDDIGWFQELAADNRVENIVDLINIIERRAGEPLPRNHELFDSTYCMPFDLVMAAAAPATRDWNRARCREYKRFNKRTPKRPQGGQVTLEDIECPSCNRPFHPRTRGVKYCSMACFEAKHLATLTVDGVTKSYREWARISGLTIQCIKSRIQRGWAPLDAVRKGAA